MNIKNNFLAVVLGCAFAALAVVLAGVGAAISMPAPLVQTLQQVAIGFDVVVLDSVLITFPLVLAFAGLAYSCRKLLKPADWRFYALLLAPLLVVEAYAALLALDQAAILLTVLLRVLLLALGTYLLVRQSKTAVS